MVVAGIVGLGLVAWAVSRGIDRISSPAPAPPPEAAAQPEGQVPHISATLFYGAPGGEDLVSVRREVALAENVSEQGRQILNAQLQPAPPPLVSVIPQGTTLRGFYVTERGDAFVDLSREAVTGHPGGSTTELLTVYAIVNAVTANLRTATRVQILIDGKEVDTLAGHIDLRRPLVPNLALVKAEGETQLR
jgi:spore germination protein GerM